MPNEGQENDANGSARELGTSFNLYLERLEQYFIANYIEEDRKVAVLLTVIGSHTYKILRDLCDPVLPKNKSYENLCSLLRKQFSTQVSVFRKRIEFYEARQNSTETVNQWYARIKNLAVHCNFGNLLEANLKDKFVTGLKKGKILDRLCEEEETKELQELLELAAKREASLKEQTEEVFKMGYKKPSVKKEEFKREAGKPEARTSKEEEAGTRKCFACGKTNHNFRSV